MADAGQRFVIYVRLLDEAVAVWRPVAAQQFEDGRFLILGQQIPEDEVWEFLPGDFVTVNVRSSKNGAYLAAHSKN